MTAKNCEVIHFQEKFSEITALYKILLKRKIRQSCFPKITDFVQNSVPMDFIIKPPESLVDALQKAVYEFVWNRKQERISRK